MLKYKKKIYTVLVIIGLIIFTLPAQEILAQGVTKRAPRHVPSPIYGVTLDSITHCGDFISALAQLTHKPTTRIVFDPGMPPSYYKKAVDQVYAVSYIMGQPVDSNSFKQYSVVGYQKRFKHYLDELSDSVDIWEIGNEINGEWLGSNDKVTKKMKVAYDLVKVRHLKTALTLYYNEGCAEKKQNEMFTWAKKSIPEDMKKNLDYVFISFYPDDCKRVRLNWQHVFGRLHQLFPNSKIGFGEIGTKNRHRKAHMIRDYYGFNSRIKSPNYVGGYFWWYFCKDMVPATKPLWKVLNASIGTSTNQN